MIGIAFPIQEAELRSKEINHFWMMYSLHTRYCGCQITLTLDRDIIIIPYANHFSQESVYTPLPCTYTTHS